MSLAVGREPHWLRLDEGAYLGFRRGPDTWIARCRDGTGEQNYNALKVPAHVRDEFVEAKRTALLANAAPAAADFFHEGAEFFERLSNGKAPDEPLIGNPDGQSWPSASQVGLQYARGRPRGCA
jgi:hypothetical protein